MASCIRCGRRKLNKDSNNNFRCPRCGVQPNGRHLLRNGKGQSDDSIDWGRNVFKVQIFLARAEQFRVLPSQPADTVAGFEQPNDELSPFHPSGPLVRGVQGEGVSDGGERLR